MRGSIFRNREFKLLFFSIFAAILLFTSVVSFYLHYQWTSLNKEMINRNIALIGDIVASHPELEKQVVASFTKELSSSDLNKGVDIAGKYGYTAELPMNTVPVINKAYIRSEYGVLISYCLLLTLLLALVYFAFRYLYVSMSSLSQGAENIMKGDFTIRLAEEGEGELPILGFQFNQMTKRLKATLEELKADKELLKNSISDISHQLKTPLTSLRMFNELLLEGTQQEAEITHEFLEKSMIQLDRMEWLIQSMLKISRLEAGVIQLERKNGDLAGTLDKAVSSLKVRWEAKEQSVKIFGIDEPHYLHHDVKWLEEALENIIKNAIDYTPEKGNITIELAEKDSTAVIAIRDTGEGIPEDELPNIFKRFYQGRKSRSASQKGSGIGLALSKLIIERHDGFIHVASKVNEGTTFTITFLKYANV